MKHQNTPTVSIPLHIRTTHHFDWGWTHEDTSREIGSAKLLKPRKVDTGRGFYARNTSLLRVVISKQTPQHLAREALIETLTPAYTDTCRHDYDCCGCRFANLQVKHVKGRTYSVRVSQYRNH